jgi:hypothetical protein
MAEPQAAVEPINASTGGAAAGEDVAAQIGTAMVNRLLAGSAFCHKLLGRKALKKCAKMPREPKVERLPELLATMTLHYPTPDISPASSMAVCCSTPIVTLRRSSCLTERPLTGELLLELSIHSHEMIAHVDDCLLWGHRAVSLHPNLDLRYIRVTD